MNITTLFQNIDPDSEHLFKKHHIAEYDARLRMDDPPWTTPLYVDREIFDDMKEIMDDTFDNYLHAFIKDTHQRLDQIHNAIDEDNSNNLENAAHALKSSAAQIGAIDLSRIAARVEILAKHKKIATISAAWDDINTVTNQSLKELQAQ